MSIGFVRNVQFTRLVKSEGKYREFNFRKMGTNSEGQFTVDTADDRGNRIILAMSKKDDYWRFVSSNAPAWVIQNEAKLHEIIEEELGLFQ
jgi:hypothetical protein